MRAPTSFAVACVLTASASAEMQDEWFREVGADSGLDWHHESGARGEFLYPEGLGGGAALFDADADGDLDLYVVQSGSLTEPHAASTNRLFLNRGDGTFVAAKDSGLEHAGYGMGVAAGDYDQDGDVDLYVTNVGPNVLWNNQGDGSFRDVTEAMGVAEGRFGSSAAFFDADGDGDLDLFCVNNLNWSAKLERECTNQYSERDYCGPETLVARSTDTLFLNEGSCFRDASEPAGLHAATGNGLGVVVADDDQDGDLDVYVANDGSPNALWRNDGKGHFTNVATGSGCSVNGNGTAEAGMGVLWVDLDEDGSLDLFLTHLRDETNTFYRGSGGRRYADRTRATRLALPSLAYTGFGVGAHDFDLDGVLDLFVANGAVQAWPKDRAYDAADRYAEPNQLFRGTGKARFEELADPVLGVPTTSRAAAFGDVDGDGDVDVVVVDRDARVKLLRNVAPRNGDWMGLRLVNERGAAALGAEARLETQPAGSSDAARSQRRLVARAYSYFASHDPRVRFALPKGHEAVAFHVRWPGSSTEVTYPVPEPGGYHELRE